MGPRDHLDIKEERKTLRPAEDGTTTVQYVAIPTQLSYGIYVTISHYGQLVLWLVMIH
jgi:hypothetical protein